MHRPHRPARLGRGALVAVAPAVLCMSACSSTHISSGTRSSLAPARGTSIQTPAPGLPSVVPTETVILPSPEATQQATSETSPGMSPSAAAAHGLRAPGLQVSIDRVQQRGPGVVTFTVTVTGNVYGGVGSVHLNAVTGDGTPITADQQSPGQPDLEPLVKEKCVSDTYSAPSGAVLTSVAATREFTHTYAHPGAHEFAATAFASSGQCGAPRSTATMTVATT